MKIKPAFLIQASLIGLLLAACAAPAPAPTATPTAIVTEPAQPVDYHFVTSQLLVPATKEQADAFALNIDGDPQNHSDNLFGGLLTLLKSASPDLELQKALDETIQAGQIVTLQRLKTTEGNQANWSGFLGETAASAPRFDGTDQFTINPAGPKDTKISGTIVNGHFSGKPGEIRAQMVIMGASMDIALVGVRVEADVNEKGCTNGKLGGGIALSEFNSKVLPALADGLNHLSDADKQLTGTLLATFDANSDGSITADEIENNVLVKLATTPDLDLMDASGKFNPRQDGVADSMSFGLGFTCAPAIFTAPGE